MAHCVVCEWVGVRRDCWAVIDSTHGDRDDDVGVRMEMEMGKQ